MQSNGRPSVVVLKSPYGRYDEGPAGGTVKPGHLIIMNSSSAWVVNPNAAGATAPIVFATENCLALRGKTIADSYASGDWLSMIHPVNGDEIQAWLETTQNVAVDDLLESAGNGELQPLTTGKPIAQALEAVDSTGGAKQIKVRTIL